MRPYCWPFSLPNGRGYRIAPFWKSVWFYPVFAVDLFSVFLQVQIFLHNDAFLPVAGVLKNVYMVLYMLPLLRYRLYKPGMIGAGCIVAGTVMNKIVMAANGRKDARVPHPVAAYRVF